MDGSRSAGTHADEDTLEPADWISASEENDRQREESVSQPKSQDQQSPAETNKSLKETKQSQEETQQSPEETHQSPAETHQSSEETHQSPAETHQSSEETTQRSAEKHQSPTAKNKSSAETNQSPSKKHQSPHNPADKHLSSPTKPDKPKPSLRPKKQQKLRDSPPTEKQKTKDSPSLKDQPEPDQTSTKQDPLKPSSVCTDQKKPGDFFCPKHEQKPDDAQKHQNQEDLCPKQQRPGEDPPPPHLNTQQAPPPLLHTQQAPLPPLLHTQQAPPPSPQVLTSMTHPNEDSTLAPPLTTEVLCEQEQGQPRPLVSFPGEPKLCGFLQKQGGPLRAWKQRWFTYEDKRNQLFYYRTPQDVTPLGRIELCSATFTYPLKAEKGTFHIKTPERTFILKAVTQELMLYWLQQLQLKRWQHRQMSTCPDLTNNNNNNTPEDFLPALKSPLGLVGEGAANVPSQRTPLTNVSLKHPLIEIQNSVHSLRKRSSQEWSQSVFHVDAPPWTPPNATDTNNTTAPSAPMTPIEPPTPPPLLSLTEPTGQVSPAEGRESPSLFDRRNRKAKNRRSSTMTLSRTETLQQEKQMLMEEVKAQKELVWILHKALEASQLEKRTCAEFLAEKGEQERLELLRHRERQAADLRGRLEEAKTEAEATRRSLAQRDAQLAELQENIGMLKEKNNAKQEVIIKLSDQVTSCMSSGGGSDSQTFRQLQQDVENLKDDIEAYKTQNKFLNSEIYQLTKLWRTSSEQEKSLMVKCAYLEASNCQVESRYLNVLRQLHETKSLDPVQRGAVQKMIEDALKGELKSVLKLNVARDHDEYGFKIIPDYEVEDMKLLAKIQALEIRSHNLLHQEAGERPLLSRWAQYLAGRSDDDLCPSPELKCLLRAGVPKEYRQQVWRWVVRTRTRTIRERHPQRYQQLCEKSRTSPHSASRQIQLDLHRTLTTNQHFSSPSSPALQQLRRVLLAFSWQNPAIGYCQGLNRVAAIALLVLQSEEEAFWCLVAVVEAIMPQDYYTKNLVASQADQRVLKDFLSEKLPRLAAHFEDYGIDVSLITFNWFMVIFVESLPSDILLPLWDAFLYEGTKVIFRYALALFKYKEDDILKIHDSVEMYQYLRFFTKTISDGRKLISVAFNDMNPFPGRLLRNRRAIHRERLQAELRELEEQQKEFVTESAERKDKELDTMVSEDDEEL
uniref:TBC1 domain family member 2A isoform X1 n=1 Tax=Epinephelus lanceolatus TaxID=310571 RepID=UPI001447F6B2|nr:TBC1 domain family member 2A isoform X1 [Epinephelus lanceolatus]XP_033478135.1 TBC1 domain family member 2A isoform X1 [Epinephelus lanceolatus]XP_033478220.1 TBC1 domain family member 2A isoform X1 [Epinephelus lanceolatus]